MATVYEIIQGLSQAAANAYDGALDENGEAVVTGLQREEGRPLIDKRVMDGFNINFNGNMMCLGFHSEVQLREVYANGFEQEIEQRIADVVKFLKKEYKKITGSGVTLSKHGEVDVRVENSSRVRSWVTAKMYYKVGGLSEDMDHNVKSEDRLEDSFKKFLDQGGWNGDGGKRPQNDTRKKES
jgi:hypothetical protein